MGAEIIGTSSGWIPISVALAYMMANEAGERTTLDAQPSGRRRSLRAVRKAQRQARKRARGHR